MGFACKIVGGHSLWLRAIALALHRPPLQLVILDFRGSAKRKGDSPQPQPRSARATARSLNREAQGRQPAASTAKRKGDSPQPQRMSAHNVSYLQNPLTG